MKKYKEYIGEMELEMSFPVQELTPYIEKYVFYKNCNISNDVTLDVFSNGKIEIFIHYNDSYLLISNKQKKVYLSSFVAGISGMENSLNITPVTTGDSFNGIKVTFSIQGVSHFIDLPVKYLFNRVLFLESVFGDFGRQLVERISKTVINLERIAILNDFFLMLFDKKKKQLPVAYTCYMIEFMSIMVVVQ